MIFDLTIGESFEIDEKTRNELQQVKQYTIQMQQMVFREPYITLVK